MPIEASKDAREGGVTSAVRAPAPASGSGRRKTQTRPEKTTCGVRARRVRLVREEGRDVSG